MLDQPQRGGAAQILKLRRRERDGDFPKLFDPTSNYLEPAHTSTLAC